MREAATYAAVERNISLGGGEAFTRLARKQIGTAASLHDIGVSKKDGLLTLWHNRAVMATWPP